MIDWMSLAIALWVPPGECVGVELPEPFAVSAMVCRVDEYQTKGE